MHDQPSFTISFILASSELKRCLSNSIGRSIRLQQGSEPNFDSDFAIRLLSILSQLKYHNKPLIYKSLAVLDTGKY